jgi:hypothetical protein
MVKLEKSGEKGIPFSPLFGRNSTYLKIKSASALHQTF